MFIVKKNEMPHLRKKSILYIADKTIIESRYVAYRELEKFLKRKEKTKTQDKPFLESLLNLIALLIIIDVFV